MEYIKGGAAAAKGFYTAGLRAGIKAGKTNKDMAALYSEIPAVSAGVYTKNIVKAAPVKWDKEITSSDNKVSAVIVNTGYANACTGDEGYNNVIEEATLAAEVFGCEKENVLIASTGIIGQQLPMEAIKKGIPMLKDALSNTVEMSETAAEAIMTTDTKPKFTAVEFTLSGKTVRLGGMCKGSGMIHPNMGTMLCFITTDAGITKQMLQKALSDDVCDTFNMVSVDGDTSTNDTVILLANGMAGNDIIDTENDDYKIFCKALNAVTTYLARAIAADGEGATKLFTVTVEGAPTKDVAVTISKSVAASSLTKAAVFGCDANWGRILCAAGYSGAKFEPEKVDITIAGEKDSLMLASSGMATDYSEEKATEILSEQEVKVIIDLKSGEAKATAWGCDLTFDYVKINADYRS